MALAAYKAGADAAAKLSLFAITVAAARQLSAPAFGVFSLGSTLGWIAAVAADFGMQLHVARAAARTPEHASHLLASWLRVRVGTAIASVLVVAGGLAIAGADTAGPIVVLTLAYAASGVTEFVHYFFRGIARSDVESSLVIGQRIATLVCALAVLAWRPALMTLAVAILGPAVMALAVSLRVAFRLSSNVEHSKVVAQGFSPAIAAPAAGLKSYATLNTFLRDIAPIGAGIVLSALYFRLDILLIELWVGTEAVGQYNAVFRIVEAGRLFPAAALAVSLPALCRAADCRPLMTVSLAVTGGAVAFSALVWPFAGVIVTLLFGPGYAPAIPAFRVLLLTFPLFSLNYALTHQVIGWDRQRGYAAICAIALAANVMLNARLIPAWSIAGAAWGTLLTEVVVTAGCLLVLGENRLGSLRHGTRGKAADPVLSTRAG